MNYTEVISVCTLLTALWQESWNKSQLSSKTLLFLLLKLFSLTITRYEMRMKEPVSSTTKRIRSKDQTPGSIPLRKLGLSWGRVLVRLSRYPRVQPDDVSPIY